MFVELPKNVVLRDAEVKDRVLHFYNISAFESLMYELTKRLSANVCLYCGKRLKKSYITMDHLYARSIGGISITNNLAVSCSSCNNSKATLTYQEFAENNFTKVREEEYLKKVQEINELCFYERGFRLPNKWYIQMPMAKIKSPKKDFIDRNGPAYLKGEMFFKKYGKLPYPVVIDKNNRILDKFTMYFLAKQENIQDIFVIKLENVELLF